MTWELFGDASRVLAQTVATRLGPSAIISMRRIKHQLVANRDGDDSQPLGD